MRSGSAAGSPRAPGAPDALNEWAYEAVGSTLKVTLTSTFVDHAAVEAVAFLVSWSNDALTTSRRSLACRRSQ
ncbi:unnamed protein product, partial [Prorocentrum cordatum]